MVRVPYRGGGATLFADLLVKRAVMSGVLPAAKPTTMRTGRDG
jgi:hypothetical protein